MKMNFDGKTFWIMLAFFGSFFNYLQGLVIWKIRIFSLQKSIGLNRTFLQNTISSLMKMKTNIRSLPVKELSNSATLHLLYLLEQKSNNTLMIINAVFINYNYKLYPTNSDPSPCSQRLKVKYYEKTTSKSRNK